MSDVTPHSPSITYLQVRKKVIKNGGEQTKVHCLAEEELLLSKFMKDMICFFRFLVLVHIAETSCSKSRGCDVPDIRVVCRIRRCADLDESEHWRLQP